ncbi:MAG: hypothetical protein AAF639_13050, partial [Chloroflexota bacterium]
VPGSCDAITANFPDSTLNITAGHYRTLILTDFDRFNKDVTTLNWFMTRLNSFKNHATVDGIVIDVREDARVAAARAQADAYPDCPVAQNLLADTIRELVLAYREQNPVEYIVILGNDHVIPFYRYPDQATLANEQNFVPPVENGTASQASLRGGYILSQDRYGTTEDISFQDDSLPLFDLAVGRLVEFPIEIAKMLDAYLDVDGVVEPPATALVTGYDFLADAAHAIRDTLEISLGESNVQTLVTDREVSPDDPASWNAGQLSSIIGSSDADIVFFAGHFSANSVLAADYETRLIAYSLSQVGDWLDWKNTLVFSPGCHIGYNIVNEHRVDGVTPVVDWTQAFAHKQATLIAGTGYQYGDTDFIEYAERLYLELTHQLTNADGPIAIGDALVTSKQLYLSQIGQLRPIHEKTLLQTTMFGLPMLKMDMPTPETETDNNWWDSISWWWNWHNFNEDHDWQWWGDGGSVLASSRDMTAPQSNQDESIVTSTAGVASGPGTQLNLHMANVAIQPALTLNHKTLNDLTNGVDSADTVQASYFVGKNGVVANPAEPILPMEQYITDAPDDDLILRGVGLRSATYTDHPHLMPLTGAPTTEIRGVHTNFHSDVFYPVQPWRINYFDRLFKQGAEGHTRMTLMPAQYRSLSHGTDTGIMREFDNMDFRLFYVDADDYSELAAAAAPPAISYVMATSTAMGNGSTMVYFTADVQGHPSAGIQEVWVTYTSLGSAGQSNSLNGQWQSLDLTQDADLSVRWTGTLVVDGSVNINDFRYMVQAANGMGLVSMDANLGAYHQADLDAGEQVDDTDPLITSPAAPAVPFAVQVMNSLNTAMPTRLTMHETAFAIHVPDGLNNSLASTDEESLVIATLTGLDNQVLTEKTVLAVIAPNISPNNEASSGGNTDTMTHLALTSDQMGQLTLTAGDLLSLGLTGGEYTLTLYFSSEVPLADGSTLDLRDDRFAPISATSTVKIDRSHTLFIPYVSQQ